MKINEIIKNLLIQAEDLEEQLQIQSHQHLQLLPFLIQAILK